MILSNKENVEKSKIVIHIDSPYCTYCDLNFKPEASTVICGILKNAYICVMKIALPVNEGSGWDKLAEKTCSTNLLAHYL